MATIILGIALSVLDGTIVNLALPSIARDLHASASQVVWVVNAYQIAILALLLPLAMLGDLVGYRRIYLLGLVLFTVASLGCVLARSLPVLAASARVAGHGRGGPDGGECGAPAAHLSEAPARTRHRHQLRRRGDRLGGRPLHRGRDPVGGDLAVALRRQPAAGARRAGDRPARAAAQPHACRAGHALAAAGSRC
jgi:MFS family permease